MAMVLFWNVQHSGQSNAGKITLIDRVLELARKNYGVSHNIVCEATDRMVTSHYNIDPMQRYAKTQLGVATPIYRTDGQVPAQWSEFSRHKISSHLHLRDMNARDNFSNLSRQRVQKLRYNVVGKGNAFQQQASDPGFGKKKQGFSPRPIIFHKCIDGVRLFSYHAPSGNSQFAAFVTVWATEFIGSNVKDGRPEPFVILGDFNCQPSDINTACSNQILHMLDEQRDDENFNLLLDGFWPQHGGVTYPAYPTFSSPDGPAKVYDFALTNRSLEVIVPFSSENMIEIARHINEDVRPSTIIPDHLPIIASWGD